MKKILTVLIAVLAIMPVMAFDYDNDDWSLDTESADIEYGYNSQTDYVPVRVGNDRIEYGFNSQSEYVPTSVGDRRIKYGYNAYGDFVPMGFKNENSPF